MTTFLMIHGAWHGGWCWRLVARLLRRRSFSVSTPSLSGLGWRRKALSADTTLHTHVTDIREAIASCKDLPIIIVAHSYAGIPVSIALQLEAISSVIGVVYIDALLVPIGRSWADDEHWRDTMSRCARVAREGNGFAWSLGTSSRIFGLSDASIIETVDRLLTPHPFATYLQPNDFESSNRGVGCAPTYYIDCTYTKDPGLYPSKRRARSDVSIRYVSLAAPHEIMLTDPDMLVSKLTEIATELRVSCRA